MGDIIIIVVFLGVLFLFLWAMVLFLERRLGKEKRGGIKMEKEVGEENMLPFIVAGVIAHEGSKGEARGRLRRKALKKKEEGMSLWRTSRR